MSDRYPGFFTAIFGGRKAKEPEPVKEKTRMSDFLTDMRKARKEARLEYLKTEESSKQDIQPDEPESDENE